MPTTTAAQAPSATVADRLTAPACVDARYRLDAVTAEVQAPGPTVAQARQIGQARRAVAKICLGEGKAGSSASARTARPPERVAPVAPFRPPELPRAAPPAPAAAAGVPPPVLTACDASGCWDSQGRRLDRAGPLLLTPQGPCVPQGGLLHCP